MPTPATRHALAAAITLGLTTPLALAQQAGADSDPNTQRQASADEREPFASFAIGDPVPELDNPEQLEWITDNKHTEWKDGEIYVLDFWATWCGPCIAAMPHLIDTQEKYADDDVHVIGVHVWARDGYPTPKEFLASPPGDLESDDFNYEVVKETGDWAAKTYMQATGSTGIPTIMIVNREGDLAWIGHPNAMDEPLAEIVAGEYDMQAAIKADEDRLAKAERERRMQQILTSPEATELQEQMQQAYSEGEVGKVVDLFDELIALDPELLSSFRVNQYRIAVNELGDGERAREVAERWLASDDPDAQSLNSFAWRIVAPGNNAYEDAGIDHTDIALKAAERANELADGEDASILDTLARVHFVNGDIQRAIVIQKRAADALPENAAGSMADEIQQRLNEYREALAERAS